MPTTVKAQLAIPPIPPKKTQARASRRNPSLVGRERFVVARSDASRRVGRPFRRLPCWPRLRFFGRIVTLCWGHPTQIGVLTDSLPPAVLLKNPAIGQPRTSTGAFSADGSRILSITRREQSADNRSPGRENQARPRPAFPHKASDGRRLRTRRQAFPPPAQPRGRQNLSTLAYQGSLRPAAFPSARSKGKESLPRSLSRSDRAADLDRS